MKNVMSLRIHMTESRVKIGKIQLKLTAITLFDLPLEKLDLYLFYSL